MEERILVLAPRGRDAQVIEQVISGEGIRAHICADASALVLALSQGASSALVTVEALDESAFAAVRAWLVSQPVWSDFPFIVLTDKRSANDDAIVQHVVNTLGNVLLVERPVKRETLRSSIHSALRARCRQYEARSLLAEREKTTAMLVETDRRKDQFLAMLAHELRNPLTPIRSAGEILKRSDVANDPTVRWVSQIIERQSRQLSSLLEDLLDISRITTGKVTLHVSEVDLNLLATRAVETAQGVMQGRKHTVTTALLEQPVFVRADPVRFAQVLSNLLDNAAKYTPVGGNIKVTLSVDQGQATVAISDDGIGISPDELPHIFEIFSQAERGLDRAEGGLGIGLSLVRSIMDMHGGSVSAQSAGYGHGTTMRATLPEVQNHCDVLPENPLPAPRSQGRPLRILIVDDNVDAAESLAMLLDMDGYHVDTANDGLRGIDAYGEKRPDVVLLDIGLPGVDGYEVMREIRQIAGARQPIAIAVTGYGQREDIERSKQAGFDHHMVKPLEISALVSILAAVSSV